MSYEAIIARNHLPPAQGEVLDMRWMASTGDWWHRTAAGWFWFDARTKQWKPAPLGPP
jgi:hypothetical protein